MENNIIQKLNLAKYKEILILNLPENISYFDSLNFENKINKNKYDCIIVFVYSLVEMSKIIKMTKEKDILEDNGRIYFAYPKKDNKKFKEYIERDQIFPFLEVNEETGYIKNTDYKFVRMVSLDNTYTVIGISKEIEKAVKVNRKSQRVADYIEMIPKLQKVLKDNQEVLNYYNSLPIGYQKDWARYIYSAATQKTIDKRINETVKLLRAGYKSISLYRKQKSTN